MNKLYMLICITIVINLVYIEYSNMMFYIKLNESAPKKGNIFIPRIQHGDIVEGVKLRKCKYEEVTYLCL